MSLRRLLYVMDVLKTSFVRYGCLKDVFYTLQMSLRRLLYVTDVFKTSFAYADLEVRQQMTDGVFSKYATSFYKEVRSSPCCCAVLLDPRLLLYVMDVLKTSLVRYGCLKDVFCTLWMSLGCPLYVMNIL